MLLACQLASQPANLLASQPASLLASQPASRLASQPAWLPLVQASRLCFHMQKPKQGCLRMQAERFFLTFCPGPGATLALAAPMQR